MSTARPRHVFLSCGEASGDRYGARLATALLQAEPGLRLSAMGGPLTAGAGAHLVHSYRDIAVMGFAEVVRALPRIRRARRAVADFLAAQAVDLVIPLDFPGFNALVAKEAKARGIPVFWLVAPQVWAWGGWRVGGLRRRIDRLGTILPFEPAFFRARGFDVFPMGHPLLDDYGDAYPLQASVDRRERDLQDPSGAPVVGLFPGSREQELRHLLPLLQATGRLLSGQAEARRFRLVASAAPGVDPARLARDLPPQTEVSSEPAPRLLERCDLALTCSGTVSLEAALAGVPHVLIYRTGALNYLLAKGLVRVPHIGLSNLILERTVVPERIQGEATAAVLAADLRAWAESPQRRQEFYDAARRIRTLCGPQGVWPRTAGAVLAFLDATGRPGPAVEPAAR